SIGQRYRTPCWTEESMSKTAKVLIWIAAGLLLMGAAYADPGYQFVYTSSTNATQSNTVLRFTGNAPGSSTGNFTATSITVINNSASANEVYVCTQTQTCTTSGVSLLAGESITFTPSQGQQGWNTMSLICDTGETATVRVIAVR